MKITPNQVFLDGTDRYEPGVEYEVSDDLALRARTAGWTGDLSEAGTVDVEPHDVVQGQASSTHGSD